MIGEFIPPIIGALTEYIARAVGVEVWEGEIPRDNSQQIEINLTPETAVIRVVLTEGGLRRDWKFEQGVQSAFGDEGPVIIQVWAVKRVDVEYNWLPAIGELLAANWNSINLGPGFSVRQMLLDSYTIVPEEQMRTPESALVYRGELRYQTIIHGYAYTLTR